MNVRRHRREPHQPLENPLKNIFSRLSEQNRVLHCALIFPRICARRSRGINENLEMKISGRYKARLALIFWQNQPRK